MGGGGGGGGRKQDIFYKKQEKCRRSKLAQRHEMEGFLMTLSSDEDYQSGLILLQDPYSGGMLPHEFQKPRIAISCDLRVKVMQPCRPGS